MKNNDFYIKEKNNKKIFENNEFDIEEDNNVKKDFEDNEFDIEENNDKKNSYKRYFEDNESDIEERKNKKNNVNNNKIIITIKDKETKDIFEAIIHRFKTDFENIDNLIINVVYQEEKDKYLNDKNLYKIFYYNK